MTARLKLAHRAGLLPPPYHLPPGLNFPPVPVPSILHNVHIPLPSHHFLWGTTKLPRCCLLEINSSTKLKRSIYFNPRMKIPLLSQVLLLWERLFQCHSAVFVFYHQSEQINFKGLTQHHQTQSECKHWSLFGGEIGHFWGPLSL